MAISDLQVELKKDSKIDQVAERRICDALLDRLDNDKSNNVQSIAVSWSVLRYTCVDHAARKHVCPPFIVFLSCSNVAVKSK